MTTEDFSWMSVAERRKVWLAMSETERERWKELEPPQPAPAPMPKDTSVVQAQKLTPCPDCGTLVSRSAEHCPNCGRPTPGAKGGHGLAYYAGMGAILFVFVLVIIGIAGSSSKSKGDGKPGIGVIYLTTTHMVARKLKSPSSAKFPSWYDKDSDIGHSDEGGGVHQFSGYVDSQNGFGAMLRTKWHATVRVEGDNVQLLKCRLGE